jgi:hypothetical protein
MDIPKNSKLITTEEVATLLGMTRQGVHKMLAAGKFKSVTYVGATRPVYLVKLSEVQKIGQGRVDSGQLHAVG